MLLLRASPRILRAAAIPLPKSISRPRSSLASRIQAALTRKQPPFPVLSTCPSPTCECAAMPADLDIDHKASISNNIAPYTSHILVSTGQSDWPSRIENAAADTTAWPWGDLTSQLKAAFGRRGQYHSETQNVLITTSSIAATGTRSILLFPANKELSIPVPNTNNDATTDPHSPDTHLTSLLDYITTQPTSPNSSSTDPAAAAALQINHPTISATPLTHPTILICSHNSRDARCGVLGPLLASEFTRQLPPHLRPSSSSTTDGIRVAMVSHVGGHKWAGNVIVYIPPGWPRSVSGIPPSLSSPSSSSPEASSPSRDTKDPHTSEDAESPLAGMGIWYGRVEPRHVEGIVRHTVLGGEVIRDLCRGVVDHTGRMIRI